MASGDGSVFGPWELGPAADRTGYGPLQYPSNWKSAGNPTFPHFDTDFVWVHLKSTTHQIKWPAALWWPLKHKLKQD